MCRGKPSHEVSEPEQNKDVVYIGKRWQQYWDMDYKMRGSNKKDKDIKKNGSQYFHYLLETEKTGMDTVVLGWNLLYLCELMISINIIT